MKAKKTKASNTTSRAKKGGKVYVASTELTLSLYNLGTHVSDPNNYLMKDERFTKNARPSFAESLSPVGFLLDDLYAMGAKLGSKVTLTLTVTE